MSSGVALLLLVPAENGKRPLMPKPVPKPEKERREAQKAERLAEQLRANLRLRKSQARELNIPEVKPDA